MQRMHRPVQLRQPRIAATQASTATAVATALTSMLVVFTALVTHSFEALESLKYSSLIAVMLAAGLGFRPALDWVLCGRCHRFQLAYHYITWHIRFAWWAIFPPESVKVLRVTTLQHSVFTLPARPYFRWAA